MAALFLRCLDALGRKRIGVIAEQLYLSLFDVDYGSWRSFRAILPRRRGSIKTCRYDIGALVGLLKPTGKDVLDIFYYSAPQH